jgi:MFS family permease
MTFNALLAILLGAIGDRVGYKKALIIGEVFPIVALAMLAISTNFFVIIFAAVIGGIAGVAGGMRGVFSPGSTALIASNWQDQKERIKKVAEMNYVGSGFAIIGSLLLYSRSFLIGSAGTIGSFRLLFALSAFLVLVSMFSLFFVEEVNRPEKTTKIMKTESAKYSLRMMVANFFNGVSLGLALPLLPLWFELKFAVPISMIGIIYTMSYIATAMGSYFTAKNAYRAKFSILFIASSTRTLQGIMLMVIAFSPLFFISSAFFITRSFIAGLGSPSRSVMNMKGVNSQDYGTAFSFIGLSNRLSQTSTGITGYLMDISLPVPIILGGLLQTIGGFIYFKVLSPKKNRPYK